MKVLFLILFTFIYCQPFFAQVTQEETDVDTLPYYQIPEYPIEYNAATVTARMIDGLGFRYYWATESLREEDLAYKPSEDGRTTLETLVHLHGLATVVHNSVKKMPNIRPAINKNIGYEQLRSETLYKLKEASDILRSADAEELENYNIVFQREENISEYPFWHQLNGPIADAIWHTGQIVLLRRSSGNPFNFKANVFMGKLRE